jgi:hypothetical protein
MKRIEMLAAASAAVMAMLAGALPARAQERMNVPFRDPSMPRKMVVDGMFGNVTVTGYQGQEAIIEMTGGRARPPRSNREEIPSGLRRIGGSGGGLDVVEEGNTIHIAGNPWFAHGDLNIQVPQQTSVSVTTMGGREVRISNVSGEIEVQNMSGAVVLENVSGSVVAHSMGGRVTASLNSVAAGKPMSFSTMNGTIDVTLPADTKANLKMETQMGEIYTDFDVQLTSRTPPAPAESGRATRGRGVTRGRVADVHVGTQSSLEGTINGGGPEIQFTSWIGNILIRKKQ